MCKRRFPELKEKYQTVIAEAELLKEERKKRLNKSRQFYGFEIIPEDDPSYDLDILEVFDDGAEV